MSVVALKALLVGAAVAQHVVLAALAQATARAAAPVTAFVNVSVVPMDRERVLEHQTVLVVGTRIAAMGPVDRIRVPNAAVRVDGRGKYLIPGLADMHAHVPGAFAMMRNPQEGGLNADGIDQAERMLFLYLANGVTTVRLMYGWPATLVLRERAVAHALLSPWIYVAAGPVDYDNSPPPDSAVKFVEAAKAAGYDFIKMHGMGGGSSSAAFDSVIATARRIGIPIVGHIPRDSAGYLRALQAGYASIEHLNGFEEYLLGPSKNTEPRMDDAKLQVLATATQRAGVWHCPTLLLSELNTYRLVQRGFSPVIQWAEMRYYSEASLKEVQAWYADRPVKQSAQDVQTPAARARAVIEAHHRAIKALQDAGVGLLLGTDAGVPAVLPGFSVHRELAALVQAGLTPYQALVTGTRNVATFLGTLDSTGTIAVGKRADLVLLTGNPLQDIRYTARPAGVVLSGRWLGRMELDARLAVLEGTIAS